MKSGIKYLAPVLAVILIVALVVILLNRQTNDLKPVTRGIVGTVTLASGNCMPTISGSQSTCSRSPVSRKVYIKQGSKIIKEVFSDQAGKYQTSLEPGSYNIYVEDEGKEYCNLWDQDMSPCKVTVTDGISEFRITIDHASH